MISFTASIELRGKETSVYVEGHCYRTVFGNITSIIDSIKMGDQDVSHHVIFKDMKRLESKLVSIYLDSVHPKGDSAHSAD